MSEGALGAKVVSAMYTYVLPSTSRIYVTGVAEDPHRQLILPKLMYGQRESKDYVEFTGGGEKSGDRAHPSQLQAVPGEDPRVLSAAQLA